MPKRKSKKLNQKRNQILMNRMCGNVRDIYLVEKINSSLICERLSIF